LHCTAVYRHQYLIEKAYGNLVGLAALMHFLCQQGGCELGELVVHATLADAELGRRRVAQLVADADAALGTAMAG
jgi:N-acetylglutamate synthase-like GNAT family acetyltransferase